MWESNGMVTFYLSHLERSVSLQQELLASVTQTSLCGVPLQYANH